VAVNGITPSTGASVENPVVTTEAVKRVTLGVVGKSIVTV
jgi:hypothetical protein